MTKDLQGSSHYLKVAGFRLWQTKGFLFMKQKKTVIINDISGFGRCSVTVALPIISKLKVQCCVVPTAILSNHTGYPTYYLWHKYGSLLSKQYWKKKIFWSDGYFACSIGEVSSATIQKYIESQG